MKKVAFACLLLILATGAAFQGARIIALILEPMQLDYAESLVVWQSLQIFHPLAAFHRLDAFPLVVFSYPPIYLVATNLLMRILGNGLFAGRLISALSGFSIVVLQGWIVFRATRRYADVRSRFIAAFVTSAIALQLSSIRTWLPLARVDVMGVALQYCALAILVLGRFRWRNQIAAMMFLLLGVYTKQTLMAMPAAALLFLACIRLPRAIQLAAVFASAGTALLAASVWLTKGGVILHWFLYNISPFSWQRALNTELALLSPTIVILACGLGGFLNFVPRRRVAARLLASPLRRTAALFGLAFAAAFVTSLSVGKMGSNINY